MTEYRVRWEINVEAENVRKAAEKARYHQTKTIFGLTVFEVFDQEDNSELVTLHESNYNKEDTMQRLKETVYAAVYEFEDKRKYIMFDTIATTPEAADDLDADFRKHAWNRDYHGHYQYIGRFKIEEDFENK